jgi:hypothetical protein
LADACVVDGVVDRLDQYEERLPDEDERELELQGVAAGLAAPAAPGARVCGLTAPMAAGWPEAAQSRCGMNAELEAPAVVTPTSNSATWDDRFIAASNGHGCCAENSSRE